MIELYSGTPGSGKSLHCAETLSRYIASGSPVLANFTVNVDNLTASLPFFVRKKRDVNALFKQVSNEWLSPENLIDYSREFWADKTVKEDEILLIIDECQILFNAREWQKTHQLGWISFFTQHRKFGYKIILVAQFDRMVDRQLRSLIEYEYIHRKVGNIGAVGRVFQVLSFGQLFVAVKRYYPLNEKLGSEFFRANKRYYSIYDTFNTFK